MKEQNKFDCKQILPLISEYLDKEIDNSLCEKIDNHVGNCQPCTQLINTLRKTLTLCQQFEPDEIPRLERKRLRDDLEKEISEFEKFMKKQKKIE